jgi:hypothetical protein
MVLPYLISTEIRKLIFFKEAKFQRDKESETQSLDFFILHSFAIKHSSFVIQYSF